MPSYNYYCPNCEKIVPAIHPYGERLAQCPECQQAGVQFIFPAPTIHTASTWAAGRGSLADQLPPIQLRTTLMGAARHGFKPGRNMVYDPGLALKQGDPEAFIPADEGESYVKKLLRKRGMGCEELGIEARPPLPKKRVKLAPDLVEEHYRNYTRRDPALKDKPKREVCEMITEKHGSTIT